LGYAAIHVPPLELLKKSRDTMPQVSVCTPTYNRAHTLDVVFESLSAQTSRDFEWLIIDDGSTDGTEEVVRAFQTAASFDIRYLRKENGGKHTALNVGIELARGELFLILDSDDRCVPYAIERFLHHWHHMTEAERSRVSTITALCCDPQGRRIGPGFPFAARVVMGPDEQWRFRDGGERWGINSTKALRCNRFPEVPGEKFMSEAVVWIKLSQSYGCKFVNETLRIYTPGTDGLTRTLFGHRLRSPVSATLVYASYRTLHLPLVTTTKIATNFWRFYFHSLFVGKKPVNDSRLRLIDVVCAPMACAVFLVDLIRSKLSARTA
jgi:glycosyltransferase involved in cell wall biosynthesis